MSIDILVNGEPEQIPEEATIFDVLQLLEFDPVNVRGLAIAVNDEVVRKSDWPDFKLTAGDSLEIVTASQGG